MRPQIKSRVQSSGTKKVSSRRHRATSIKGAKMEGSKQVNLRGRK